MSGIAELGFVNNGYKNLKHLMINFYQNVGVLPFLLENVLYDIYCDPYGKIPSIINDTKKLIDDNNELKRKRKILDHVEARQENNSIWKVLDV